MGSETTVAAKSLPEPDQVVRHDRLEEAWVSNVGLLWENRRTLVRVGVLTFVLSASFAFLMPKQYESSARIMPPDQATGSAAMLAALAGREDPQRAGWPASLAGYSADAETAQSSSACCEAAQSAGISSIDSNCSKSTKSATLCGHCEDTGSKDNYLRRQQEWSYHDCG